MNPQPFTDLAERFALIIEGLCKVIAAQQGGFLTRFVLHLFPSRSRLIREQLAELAALIRSGKLFMPAPSRTYTDAGGASSRPPSSGLARPGPARLRAARGGVWLAGQEEAEEGVVMWRLSDLPVLKSGADRAADGAELAPVLPGAVHDASVADQGACQAAESIQPGRPAPDEARNLSRPERDAAARASSSRVRPACDQVVHALGDRTSADRAPMLAQVAAPLAAWRARLRAPPPDAAFFASLSLARLSTS